MFYKLSSITSRDVIEQEFDKKFNFPNLYKPRSIINGLKESTISVITNQNPNQINHAIWGLLPENFDDDWKSYQNINNTLNLNLAKVEASDALFYNPLNTNRCIILVSGFFTSKLYKGKLFPHHVHLKDHKPFGIAGVFNSLEDGFITCALLVTKTGKSFDEIPNLSKNKPLIFKKEDFPMWLDSTKSYEDLKPMIQNHETLEFLSHPIEEEFYKDAEIYEEIVESKYYESMVKNG